MCHRKIASHLHSIGGQQEAAVKRGLLWVEWYWNEMRISRWPRLLLEVDEEVSEQDWRGVRRAVVTSVHRMTMKFCWIRGESLKWRKGRAMVKRGGSQIVCCEAVHGPSLMPYELIADPENVCFRMPEVERRWTLWCNRA